VLLEIEGVLADTRDARRHALADALAERGLTLGHDAIARAADGHAPSVAVARAAEQSGATLDPVDVDLLALAATRSFADYASRGVSLVRGAREAIASLASYVRVAVVTRAPAQVAERILALAELDTLVTTVVAADHVAAAKPSPAGYRRALARLGHVRPVTPRHVVALEDGAVGLAAAHAAGVTGVAVGDGARDATPAAMWVASAVELPYDALVHLLDSLGGRGA
jgi:HAD superfamily hydrolase (TIGR01509 family)